MFCYTIKMLGSVLLILVDTSMNLGILLVEYSSAIRKGAMF